MNVLNDTEINEILKKYNIKINGIFQKDKIDYLKKGFYIINLQSSIYGSGSHWCCLYFDPDMSFWWDSFGFPPPTEIELLLNSYDYNKYDIQNISTSSCGFYCIAFIKFLYNKKDKKKAFETFINLFKDNTFNNEKILYDLLYVI